MKSKSQTWPGLHLIFSDADGQEMVVMRRYGDVRSYSFYQANVIAQGSIKSIYFVLGYVNT